MSVKSKVKRCNKEIKKLQDELERYKFSNKILRDKLDNQIDNELLENIVKFIITEHFGRLYGAIRIDHRSIYKMRDLDLFIRYDIEFNSYIMQIGRRFY